MEVMLLKYPGKHVQPETTVPVLKAGHGAGAHVDTKNGDPEVAVTRPRYRVLHRQPCPTLLPALLAGHGTAVG